MLVGFTGSADTDGAGASSGAWLPTGELLPAAPVDTLGAFASKGVAAAPLRLALHRAVPPIKRRLVIAIATARARARAAVFWGEGAAGFKVESADVVSVRRGASGTTEIERPSFTGMLSEK